MSKFEHHEEVDWAIRPKAATLHQAVQYADELLQRWNRTGYDRDYLDAAYAVAMDDRRWSESDSWALLVEACRELK